MEIQTNNHRLMFLRRILHETRTQEKLSESIVPDSYPDIADIVDVFAFPVLSGKECRQGVVTVSAAIRGGILYRPEGDEPLRYLDYYIPTEYRFENEHLTEQTQVVCTICVKNLDGRMINSRKAMLRAELSYRVCAYEQEELMIPVMEDVPEEIQLHMQTYDFTLPLEIAEKSFMIGEILDLPPSIPAEQILKIDCIPKITDKRLLGNRGIFKGNVNCKMLYLGNDQKLHTFVQQLPFSQYCEFAGDYDDDTIALYPTVSDIDLEVDRTGNMSRIPVSIYLLVQTVVSGKRTVRVADDAYTTSGTLDAEWENGELDTSLDSCKNTIMLDGFAGILLRDILNYEMYVDYPSVQRNGDQIELNVSANVHILGVDETNTVVGCKVKLSKTQKIVLAANGICMAEAQVEGPVHITPVSNDTEIRLDAGVVIHCSASQSLRYLTHAKMDLDDTEANEPALLVRRFPEGGSIWEIAKAYRVKPEAIMQINGISGDYFDDNAILLLPVE